MPNSSANGMAISDVNTPMYECGADALQRAVQNIMADLGPPPAHGGWVCEGRGNSRQSLHHHAARFQGSAAWAARGAEYVFSDAVRIGHTTGQASSEVSPGTGVRPRAVKTGFPSPSVKLIAPDNTVKNACCAVEAQHGT